MAVPVGPLSATRLRRTESIAPLVDELASFGGAVRARGEFFPVDLDASGVDDAAGGGGKLRGPMPSPAN